LKLETCPIRRYFSPSVVGHPNQTELPPMTVDRQTAAGIENTSEDENKLQTTFIRFDSKQKIENRRIKGIDHHQHIRTHIYTYIHPTSLNIMSNAAVQAKANALNAKMEEKAGTAIEDIEKNLMRKVARESFSCATKCYDKAGTTGPSEVLENCARNCQVPYQQATQLVQQVRTTKTKIQIIQSLVLLVVGA
jgi:cytoskeletal protein RodZ